MFYIFVKRVTIEGSKATLLAAFLMHWITRKKKEKMEELTSRPLEDSLEARNSRRRAVFFAGSVASAALANPARVSGREVFCFLLWGFCLGYLR